jgi:hypothetical protein
VSAKKPFAKDGPPAAQARDLSGGKAHDFLTARADGGGGGGLRLSPGPTAVWILSNGSGGTRTKREPMDRVRDLCDKLRWASYLAPLRVMPYSWLISPIVAYHCKLAEAYIKAAGALDDLFGDKPKDDGKLKDLENHIRGLGPGLLGDLAESAVLNGVAHGIIAPAIHQVGTSIVSPLLGWANRAGAGLIGRASGGGARAAGDTAAAAAARTATAEARVAAEAMGRAGMSQAEIAAALRAESRAAAETAATRAAAGEGSQPALRDISEAGLRAEAQAGRELSAALEKYYQGRPMPPIHVTDAAGIRETGDTLARPLGRKAKPRGKL